MRKKKFFKENIILIDYKDRIKYNFFKKFLCKSKKKKRLISLTLPRIVKR